MISVKFEYQRMFTAPNFTEQYTTRQTRACKTFFFSHFFYLFVVIYFDKSFHAFCTRYELVSGEHRLLKCPCKTMVFFSKFILPCRRWRDFRKFCLTRLPRASITPSAIDELRYRRQKRFFFRGKLFFA